MLTGGAGWSCGTEAARCDPWAAPFPACGTSCVDEFERFIAHSVELGNCFLPWTDRKSVVPANLSIRMLPHRFRDRENLDTRCRYTHVCVLVRDLPQPGRTPRETVVVRSRETTCSRKVSRGWYGTHTRLQPWSSVKLAMFLQCDPQPGVDPVAVSPHTCHACALPGLNHRPRVPQQLVSQPGGMP